MLRFEYRTRCRCRLQVALQHTCSAAVPAGALRPHRHCIFVTPSSSLTPFACRRRFTVATSSDATAITMHDAT